MMHATEMSVDTVSAFVPFIPMYTTAKAIRTAVKAMPTVGVRKRLLMRRNTLGINPSRAMP